VTLLEKYFIDLPLKNVFFILRGIYRKRKKIIMKKVIRLTESEFISLVKKVINESKNGNVNEQMSTMANAVKSMSAQGPEPSWLKYPKQQYMSIQPKLKMANPKIVLTAQNACYSSVMDASFGFIIPQNTKFVAKGNFFIGSVFRVEKSRIDPVKVGNPAYLNGVIANAQKFGLTATQVALNQDGSILFPNGDTQFKLYGNGGLALSQSAVKSFV
jgi:hypothetical protein